MSSWREVCVLLKQKKVQQECNAKTFWLNSEKKRKRLERESWACLSDRVRDGWSEWVFRFYSQAWAWAGALGTDDGLNIEDIACRLSYTVNSFNIRQNGRVCLVKYLMMLIASALRLSTTLSAKFQFFRLYCYFIWRISSLRSPSYIQAHFRGI